MKENTHNSWEDALEEIIKHPESARRFAQGLLYRALGHHVKVQSVTKSTKDCYTQSYRRIRSSSPTLFLVAEDPSYFANKSYKSRHIRILLQNPSSLPTLTKTPATSPSVTLYYDCVEAPAILMDRGITDIRLVVDKEVQEYIYQFKNAMECV